MTTSPSRVHTTAARLFCHDHDLELSEVSAHGWLVRSREPRGELDGLLGCIEERERRFELMQIGSNFRWTTFDTLLEALAHLVDNLHLPSAGSRLSPVDAHVWSAPQ